MLVGGQSATDVDANHFVLGRAPTVVGFVVVVTLVVLFILLGSVVLPFEAVVVNFLSITGSFGALVWIFQEGHLRRLLDFEPGPLEPALPVLLFCTLFGLSMDYEVLLLSRIREEWERTHDNRRSVAEGLERTASLITSAAAIMVAVFAAFALARIVVVKAMGVGMAIAVALDATLVRVLIVPATMRLFGNLNWWAPAGVEEAGAGGTRGGQGQRMNPLLAGLAVLALILLLEGHLRLRGVLARRRPPPAAPSSGALGHRHPPGARPRRRARRRTSVPSWRWSTPGRWSSSSCSTPKTTRRPRSFAG